MKLSIQVGSTSQTINVFIQDSSSTTGAGLTGLVFNTSGLTAYYALPRAAAAAITLATLASATAAWATGGFIQIDATNMPGWYRFDVPNAVLASGRFVSLHLKGAANMAPLPIEIELTAWNNQDAVRGGMTALPNAAAEGAGGLYTRGSGAGQINQTNNGQIDVDAKRINGVLTTSVTTINANQGTTQPVNFTGTAGSALVKSDSVNLGGVAQTGRDVGASVLLSAGTGTGQLDFTAGIVKSNLVQILGTLLTETAGQIAAGFKKFFNVTTPTAQVDLLPLNTDYTAARAAKLDNLDATISSRSSSAALATVQSDTDDIQTRLPAALVGGKMDSTVSALGTNGSGLTAIPWNPSWDAEVQSECDDALVARNLDKLIAVAGTASSGSTTTLVDAARTQGDTDYWKGALIVFTSGNIAGQARWITDFNPSTDTFTFGPPTTQAVTTQSYVIFPRASVWDETISKHLSSGSTGAALNAAGSAGDPWTTPLPGAYGAGTAGKIVGDNLNATVSSRATSVQATDIQSRLPVALVGGKMDSNVGSLGTNAITAAVLAPDAVAEIQAAILSDGVPFPGAHIDAPVSSSATPTQVKTQVVAALNTDIYPEPPQGTPAASNTLAAKIGFLFKAWRNKVAQTATEQRVYNDAGTVVDHKATFSDDGTTATRGPITTGP
jgi:hypothetical protein